MDLKEVKELLDEALIIYNRAVFIVADPVSIPHLFNKKEDIEISGFLTATISWGQRKSIVKSAKALLERMDFEPYQFILQAGNAEINALNSFVYRTFQGIDLIYFIKSLRNIYKNHDGLEGVFSRHPNDIGAGIAELNRIFFSLSYPLRTRKHLANPEKGSAAKRINMFLRWMVRTDAEGIDFGIWPGISPSSLYCPLDIHSGNTARELGLLKRKANDWKAVTELTNNLKKLDPDDPVKYDIALFGLGVAGFWMPG